MFENYLNENYKKNLKMFKEYCYKNYNGRLNNEEMEDVYQDTIVNVLKSKAYNTNTINDLNAYFWITLRNQVVHFIKNKYKRIGNKEDNIKISFIDIKELEEYLYEDFEEDKFNIGGFDRLINKSKEILDQFEYKIFINYIFNKMTYREIADLLGYSAAMIYLKNKQIFIKIKKELDENGQDYFN